MNKLAIVAAALLTTAAMPAVAAETLSVPFITPSTGTTGLYSGTVSVTVSGFGNSRGSDTNDAFYLFNSITAQHDPSYYQLNFSLSPLQPFEPQNNIVASVIGGLPAYNPSHVYSFLLNTGTNVASTLYFGVADGRYDDNGGSYSISISAVPEPSTWGFMILGFGMAGAAMRVRRRQGAFA